jgi:glucose-6-phosphate isomerase
MTTTTTNELGPRKGKMKVATTATTDGRLTARASWKALRAHHQKIQGLHLRTLFAEDEKRGERLTAEAAGLYLDYSKNRITDETLVLLRRLAEEAGLRGRIDAMFRGDKINLTENRAVLHVALRAPRGSSVRVDGRTSCRASTR